MTGPLSSTWESRKFWLFRLENGVVRSIPFDLRRIRSFLTCSADFNILWSGRSSTLSNLWTRFPQVSFASNLVRGVQERESVLRREERGRRGQLRVSRISLDGLTKKTDCCTLVICVDGKHSRFRKYPKSCGRGQSNDINDFFWRLTYISSRVIESVWRSAEREVWGSSLAGRVFSLDKELYSTLSLFTQVYKWVPATYCWRITML